MVQSGASPVWDREIGLRIYRLMTAVVLVVLPACTEEVEVKLPPRGSANTTASKQAKAEVQPEVLSPIPIEIDDPELPAKTRDGWIRGTLIPATSQYSRESHSRLIAEELTHYPAAFLKRIGLQRVVLCNDLTFEKTPCLAYADVEHGRLYVNATTGSDPAHARRTVHHEVFHQIDFAADQRLDADPVWEAVNPPGFRYAMNAESLQSDHEASRPDDSLRGFLNRYAMSSPAEDKAEVFAYLVTDRTMMRERIVGDAILRRKSELIRTAIDQFGPYSRELLDR